MISVTLEFSRRTVTLRVSSTSVVKKPVPCQNHHVSGVNCLSADFDIELASFDLRPHAPKRNSQ